MPTTLILGNGAAALAAIEALRANGAQDQITLFCPQGVPPYHQGLLAAWLAKDVKESQVAIKMEGLVRGLKVNLIHDERLTRVSPRRRQLTTQKKTHVPFDRLLITDLPDIVYPPLKGLSKQGVHSTALFGSVREMINNLHEIDHALVQVSSLNGFDFACALSRLGKDVVMLVPKEGLLADLFDEETSLLLKQIVEGKGIRVIADDIEEVLGDVQAKAARLESGKVMAAQCVLFDRVAPDLRLLAEADLLEDGALKVSATGQTRVDNIFAAGTAVSGFGQSEDELAFSGRAAALGMLGIAPAPPVVPAPTAHDFGARVCDGFYCGQLRLPPGGREHMRFDGPSNVYKKLFLSCDRLVGAVVFNAMGEKPRVLKALGDGLLLPCGGEEQFL